MKKLLFVYNPRSGKGLIRSNLSSIIEVFSEKEFDVTVYPTKCQLDACETVTQRAAEFDLIVCSGGDGTLDEVVTGLVRSGVKRPIGYIPAGSTNDFGNSIGIPKEMEQAARQIVDGEPFACDVGKFNEDYFIYVAAFGIFTDVSYQTPQEMKNALGHAAYVLEGMKRMGTWKSCNLKIESEEYTGEGEYVLGMITNTNTVAGFKGITGKDVELNDGLFEVMLVRAPKNLVEWQETITSVLIQDQKSDMVQRFKTNRIRITSDEPVAWTRDGESGGEQTEVELANMCQEVEIITEKTESEEPAESLPVTESPES